MKATRESLTEKVAALEQQVVGTIQEATCTVHDTIHTVKSAMHDTVSSVQSSVSQAKENVKAAFDVAGHVRERPWAMVGGAAAVGFLAGYLVGGDSRRTSGTTNSWAANDTADGSRKAVRGFAAAASSSRPSFIDDLIGMAQRELRTLGEQALAKLSTSIKQSLNEGIETLAHNTSNLVGTGFGMMGQEHGYDEESGEAHAHNGRGMNGNRI